MQWIFENRQALAKIKPKDISPFLLQTATRENLRATPQPRQPSVAPSVIVQTAAEKQLAKELRKEQK